MNTFEVGSQVKVRHSKSNSSFSRYSIIEPTITWHDGKVIAIREDEIKVELNSEFNGFKTVVVNKCQVVLS